MEDGVNGLNGPFAMQPAMVVENGDPDFVTLHFQLMVEEIVLGMVTKR